jgi:hypothetical protein
LTMHKFHCCGKLNSDDPFSYIHVYDMSHIIGCCVLLPTIAIGLSW